VSGLFGSLTLAARALDAQQFGLDVVGQNIANVNTAGYTRRELDLAEVPPYGSQSAGGGVEVEGVRAVRDMLLERRFRQEIPDQQRAAAIVDGVALVESALGTAGASIDADLTAFFDTFAGLAQDPTSATARQQVMLQGSSLAGAFRDMAAQLDAAQRDANSRILSGVTEANSLLEQIARLNTSIAGTAGTDVQHLKDEQGEAIRKLAEIIDVAVIQRQDGGVDLTVGPGRALVIGDNHYDLQTVSNSSGLAQLTVNGTDITAEVTSGRIGGLLHVRDTLIPAYMSDLDDIAYAVATQVNAVHDAGYDLTGTDAGLFFDDLGADPAGAAKNIRITTAIAGNPSLIAAAGIPSAGDNQTARAIAALRDQRVLSGNTATFTDAWGTLVFRVGADGAAARTDNATRADVIRQIENLRDATSGVSLDQEATMMIKFQRAYEANAKFFTTITETILTLMNMLEI
jgi:flagellar hook-associated protein 1